MPKPHSFQFVPNEKQVRYNGKACYTIYIGNLELIHNIFLFIQVKESNKLLKIMSHNGGRKKVDGVPVFSAQNLRHCYSNNRWDTVVCQSVQSTILFNFKVLIYCNSYFFPHMVQTSASPGMYKKNPIT